MQSFSRLLGFRWSIVLMIFVFLLHYPNLHCIHRLTITLKWHFLTYLCCCLLVAGVSFRFYQRSIKQIVIASLSAISFCFWRSYWSFLQKFQVFQGSFSSFFSPKRSGNLVFYLIVSKRALYYFLFTGLEFKIINLWIPT